MVDIEDPFPLLDDADPGRRDVIVHRLPVFVFQDHFDPVQPGFRRAPERRIVEGQVHLHGIVDPRPERDFTLEGRHTGALFREPGIIIHLQESGGGHAGVVPERNLMVLDGLRPVQGGGMDHGLRNAVRRIGQDQLRPAEEPADIGIGGSMEHVTLRLKRLDPHGDGIFPPGNQIRTDFDFPGNPALQDRRHFAVDPDLPRRIERFHPKQGVAEGIHLDTGPEVITLSGVLQASMGRRQLNLFPG